MRRYLTWVTCLAVLSAGVAASAQVSPINPLQSVETVPCPLAFENASAFSSGSTGAVTGATSSTSISTTPGTAATPALTNPLTNGFRTNPGTAINPGIPNSPQLESTAFGLSSSGFNANAGLPTLSQPVPGTGFSSGKPLQFTTGSGFSQGAGFTPSVGFSSTGSTQISGFNPGATISPAVTGSPTTTFGVTC